MRIVIVGTAYPLRGGIAHYIALVREALVRRGHEVRILTFKRQYPKLLFPGKSQEEVESRDERSSADGTRFRSPLSLFGQLIGSKEGETALAKEPL